MVVELTYKEILEVLEEHVNKIVCNCSKAEVTNGYVISENILVKVEIKED